MNVIRSSCLAILSLVVAVAGSAQEAERPAVEAAPESAADRAAAGDAAADAADTPREAARAGPNRDVGPRRRGPHRRGEVLRDDRESAAEPRPDARERMRERAGKEGPPAGEERPSGPRHRARPKERVKADPVRGVERREPKEGVQDPQAGARAAMGGRSEAEEPLSRGEPGQTPGRGKRQRAGRR